MKIGQGKKLRHFYIIIDCKVQPSDSSTSGASAIATGISAETGFSGRNPFVFRNDEMKFFENFRV